MDRVAVRDGLRRGDTDHPGLGGPGIDVAKAGDEQYSRRQQEQTRRLDWVLRAAEAVFLERGYGGAGMVEIAKRAGLPGR